MDAERWAALVRALGGLERTALFSRLLAAYGEPHRHYHTGAHIGDCLRLFDANQGLARYPAEVEAALWFHDAIYDPARQDNEARSADFAREGLRGAGVASGSCERVAGLILATRHLEIPADSDTTLLVDIDLAILGQDAGAFALYETQIRREYQWVPWPQYCGARVRILRGFLARTFLYGTAAFRARFEAAARRNLAQAIEALEAQD